MKIKFSDWIQIILAFCTIITLIAYILVSRHQFRQTEEAIRRADTANFYTRQSIELAKQNGISSDSLNRKAIQIADSSMKISKSIAEMQKEFTKKELRAYINISKERITGSYTNQDIIYFIDYTNTGKTPAFEIIGSANVKHGGTGVYENEISIYNKPNKGDFCSIAGAGATGSIGMGCKDKLCGIDSSVLHNGTQDFYIYGSIFYKDIFGDRHRTRFCYKYSFARNIFSTYKRYNDSY
jgi:hypothetical protein